MRILVVEDDPALRAQIQSQLRAEGHAVDLAPDGREGLFLGSENPYDLAVVDLGLPDLDGISLIRQLREGGQTYPVLILTARGGWQDKVEGLESGADDYLTKPFHPEELRARLNALLRRASGHASALIRSGNLSIDTSARQVTLDDKTVELTGYEYQALAYLALNRGKVISKTELTEHLYDQDFDRDSNVIEVFIGRLRRKLGSERITTVRGLGYRFNRPEDEQP